MMRALGSLYARIIARRLCSLKEETFAVGPDREIFAFRGKKLSRSNDFRIFRGKKLSRIVDFREFAQINFYGIFNNQVREKDRVYFCLI